MDTTSPLMQALRTEHGANTDRGMSDVNTGEMTAVMSYDQVSYLLTVMVTVSVVSILILIFSVTLILGFLWYTRNLLHSAKCGCPGPGLPSSSSASVNIPCTSLQSGHLYPPQPPQWRHGGPGHPHHQPGHRGQGVLLYSSDKLHRPSKHVTVNPLPPPTLPAINSAHRRLVPSIKQSAASSERSSDNSISSADYEINHTNPDEKTGNETAEPIYAEIRAKEIKDDQHRPVKSSESESKQNKSEQNEQHQELSGKKEIEYWQITAKEVVKFRPCTETFIVRE